MELELGCFFFETNMAKKWPFQELKWSLQRASLHPSWRPIMKGPKVSDNPPISSVFAQGLQVGLKSKKFDIWSKICCLFHTTTQSCCKLPICNLQPVVSWCLQLQWLISSGYSPRREDRRAGNCRRPTEVTEVRDKISFISLLLFRINGWFAEDWWWWCWLSVTTLCWWRWSVMMVTMIMWTAMTMTTTLLFAVSNPQRQKGPLPFSQHFVFQQENLAAVILWGDELAVPLVPLPLPDRGELGGMDGFWTKMSRQELDKWM